VLHQIGVGALGPVFRAFDPERDRLVAVKRFQLDVPPERMHELVALFERLIASQLMHPAVATPVATGMDGTAAYLAMDYVLGDALDTAVRDYGPAPPAEALRVATELAGALDFAAVVNVEHGALHPRDVLLSGDEPRITGLGVARALETIGVPVPARRPYSAPERHVGQVWDRRSDIFSLAALIHELLWGRRIAGAGPRAADAVTDIPGGDLPALRDVFARALATAATDRFATALEFADALKAALPNVSLVPGPPATAKRQRRQALPLLDDEADLPITPADKSPVDPTTRIEAEQPRIVASAPILMDEASDAGELDLRQAEADRYQDVESAPAIVEPLPPPPRREPSPDFVDTRPEFMASAIEQSRSAVWPLVLALIVGVAIGFAGGYGVGSRDRTAPGATAAPPPATPTETPTPAGHDSTEVAVADAQKTTPVGSTGGGDAPLAVPVTPPKPPAPPEKTQTAKAEPTKSEPVKSESAPGRLLVRSSPAGARVFVDGHEYGKTPLAVHDLGRGSHRVRVVREGYGTEERRIVLTATRPAQSITVPLERDRAQIAQARKTAVDRAETPGTAGAFSGPLTVESRPTGAHVYLDGKLVGTTPLQLPEVTAGEHAVRLEHDGYRLWSSSVRVIATERNRVTASLER
jgi:serine/threonine protein kinase